MKTGSAMKKLGIIMFAVTLLSCNLGSGSDDDWDPTALKPEFRSRKTAWESQNINHYRYAVQLSTNSIGPTPITTILVSPNRVPEIVHQTWPHPNPFGSDRLITIDDVFNLLEDNINHVLEYDDMRLVVEYDARYHFPKNVERSTFLPGGDGGVSWILRIFTFEDLRSSDD